MRYLALLLSVSALLAAACDSSESSTKEDVSQVIPDTTSEDSLDENDIVLPDDFTDVQARQDLLPFDVIQDLAIPDTQVPDTMQDVEPLDLPKPEDLAPADIMPEDLVPEDVNPTDVPPTDVAAGACNNSADINAFATSSVADIMKSCAMGCIGKGAECGATCSQEKMGLSQPCSMCVGELLVCTMSQCMMTCISGGAACNECIAEKCGSDFETCAGIAIP